MTRVTLYWMLILQIIYLAGLNTVTPKNFLLGILFIVSITATIYSFIVIIIMLLNLSIPKLKEKVKHFRYSNKVVNFLLPDFHKYDIAHIKSFALLLVISSSIVMVLPYFLDK